MLKLLAHQVQLLALAFTWALFSSLMGAFTGWVVGLFFGKTILGILATLGIEGFKMWQIGATLGFIGSFFRTLTFNDQKNVTTKG